MQTRAIKVTVSSLAVAGLAAACGGTSASDGSSTSSSMPSMSSSPSMSTGTMTNAADSQAAGLRSQLTALLDDHVWLAGNALQTAVRYHGNLKNPQVKAAVAALDDNSVALAKTIGSVYPSAQKPFLAQWRQHIGYFVDYTLARAQGDAAGQAKAERELAGYRVASGKLLHSVIPQLSASAVSDELKPHIASLIAAINAAVANKPDFQTKLATSSVHMLMFGGILADGIDANKGLTGDPSGKASVLRATLTQELNDHVWLAGNALQTAVLEKGDLKNKQVVGAVAALDANSVALAKTVGSVYPSAEKPFLASWRQHIGFFENYTLARAGKDAAGEKKAERQLAAYSVSSGKLLHSVIKPLSARSVAAEFRPHIATLLTAINAAVAGSPTFQSKLTTAADHMTMTADLLAEGIVTDQHIKN